MDLESLKKQAFKEIKEEAHDHNSKKEVAIQETSTGTMAPAYSFAERERARVQRVCVKLGWMKEFCYNQY